ncbi:MAG: flagellar assembly protein FliW [Oscillospiraceae bacterium]|jgi:flagellar assembly factor FliW|nr:flagellar assembly protein FliW [Oscillospiraceae bacterium]
MQISTTRFGDVNIAAGKIIHMPDGLPGLEGFTRYALLSTEETDPFHWLQSLEAADVSLAVINPYLLFPEYKPLVPEGVFTQLGVDRTEDVLVLTVAVIPQDFRHMTTNLLAPVLINTKNNCGKQVILENGEYDLRHPIFEKMRMLVHRGGAPDAGAD